MAPIRIVIIMIIIIQTITSLGEDVKKLEPLYIAVGDVKAVQSLWKIVG